MKARASKSQLFQTKLIWEVKSSIPNIVFACEAIINEEITLRSSGRPRFSNSFSGAAFGRVAPVVLFVWWWCLAAMVVASKTAKNKSPAEFFAENQTIAGFDNPGKALYTTVRELVENSLDACEALRVLPVVELTLTEVTTPTNQPTNQPT